MEGTLDPPAVSGGKLFADGRATRPDAASGRIASPGGLRASGDPELREMGFTILPLTDCAPIAVAHERGFFARHGIESHVVRCSSWTAARDRLLAGETHGAQMLFGMPVAGAVGKLGVERTPLIVPWVLSRNGQAITLASKYRGRFGANARALRPLVHEQRDKGRPMVFGMTLQPGTHAMWLRYWLAAGGVDPDNDVVLITVPPPQMAANMRGARMDGFCVGEPWNALAVADDLGFTAILTEEIWPGHPEKVLAFTEEFAATHPRAVKAVLKALYEAGAWCDDPSHRDELAALLADPRYIGAPPEMILSRLGPRIDCGDGRIVEALQGVTFAARGSNCPQPKHAIWWLSQLRRWGMLHAAPDYAEIAARVMRPDLYEAAMIELGVPPVAPDDEPETLFDGTVFHPSQPEEYAAGFDITRLHHLATTGSHE